MSLEYRVEAVRWDGHDKGAAHLTELLNEWAGDGWRFVSMMPTTAGTSIRGIVTAGASADTSEFAVVLERDRPR